MNRAKACAFAATAAATVVLIAGCGGGDDTANADTEFTVTTGSLTKAEFKKRVEAICRERIEEVEAKFSAFLRRNDIGNSGSRSEFAPKAEELIETIYLPAHEREMDRIASLGAPSGDEQEVAAVFEAVQEGLDEAKAHPLTFVQALSKTYEPFAKAEKLADAYGVPSCGRG